MIRKTYAALVVLFTLAFVGGYCWWYTTPKVYFFNSNTACNVWWFAHVTKETNKKGAGHIPGSLLTYTVIDLEISPPWGDITYQFYYSNGQEQVEDRTIHKDGIYRHGTRCEWSKRTHR